MSHSKKRRAEDLAKKIRKKSKKRKLVIRNFSSESEIIPETPLEVVVTKSCTEEVPTSNIVANVSDTGAHVLMSDVSLSQVIPVIVSSAPISATFVSLLPVIISTVPTSSSSNFTQILNQPFTTLFSSQSTDPPKSNEPPKPLEDSKTEDTGFGGTFEALEFEDEEENFPDHMLISMKQFKILNKNLNSIIQSQVDMGVAILCQEWRLMKNELRIKSQSSTFNGEVQEFRRLAKERHVMFVQDVKKVREDVNFKLQELREDMEKEIEVVQRDYASLNQQVDVIVEVLATFVKLYEAESPQLSQLSTTESTSFVKINNHFKELKALISKSISSPLITAEFLSQEFTHSKAILQKQVAHLSRISNILPTDAPPVITGTLLTVR
ncbi:unnamed protein product [Lactuca saligna]|uniref:Uncharacterized protein n=1 Tax=Lactuca saligna TaxID=75948 RepID=A0AA35YVN1_LACSI|nr:unnamed protein product [Lactuca saligna]